MALTLYCFGPGANSLKPLLTLYERGIPFTQRALNPGTFEHHEPWFVKINPRGQVPALDHDGKVVTESTVICEYLEDEFPQYPSLRPADSFGKAQMRIWTKWVDEYFCWCVSTIGWHRIIGQMTKNLSDEEFEKYVERIPVYEQRVKWRTARKGFPQEVIDEEMRKVKFSVTHLNDRLKESKWLAGPDYSLADICNFAIAGGMERGWAEMVNEKDTPYLVDWIKRVQERPAVKKMYAEAQVPPAERNMRPTAAAE